MKFKLIAFSAWCFGVFAGSFLEIEFFDQLEGISEGLLSYFNLWKIISSNFLVLIINIVGALSFGGLTFINLFYNGLSYAYLFKVVALMDKSLLINLLPHSLEIVGFIIAGSVGINIGVQLFKWVILEKPLSLLKNIKGYFNDLLVASSIILIAAFIEFNFSVKL